MEREGLSLGSSMPLARRWYTPPTFVAAGVSALPWTPPAALTSRNHAADFTSGTCFVILLFDLGAIVEDSGFRGWDRAEQCTAERQFLSARTIGQKAELPDAHKAAGQGMQQETPDELRCFQSHDLPLIAVGVVVTITTGAFVADFLPAGEHHVF
jgi:hypothetical protein